MDPLHQGLTVELRIQSSEHPEHANSLPMSLPCRMDSPTGKTHQFGRRKPGHQGEDGGGEVHSDPVTIGPDEDVGLLCVEKLAERQKERTGLKS